MGFDITPDEPERTEEELNRAKALQAAIGRGPTIHIWDEASGIDDAIFDNAQSWPERVLVCDFKVPQIFFRRKHDDES